MMFILGPIALWLTLIGVSVFTVYLFPWLILLVLLFLYGMVLHVRDAWRINHAAGKRVVPWL